MTKSKLLPEEKARIKIDRQLTNAGWDIVSRDEYVPPDGISYHGMSMFRGARPLSKKH